MSKQCQQPQAHPYRCGCVREIAEHNAKAYAEAIAALAAKEAQIAELEQKIIGLEDAFASNLDYRAMYRQLRAQLASQQQAEPLIDTSAWQSCNPGCDPEFNGEKSRHCSCEPAKAAIAEQQADPTMAKNANVAATHSEDGREVPERYTLGGHCDSFGQNCGAEMERDEDGEYMTVAQHERILDAERGVLLSQCRDWRVKFMNMEAEKDAEIARLEKECTALAASACDGVVGDDYGHSSCRYKKELEQLRAQPARQVGDDWPKLDKPAKVGGGRFSVGVSARLVVEDAQRQYEYDVTPEKEAERIAKAAGFLGSLRGAGQVGEPDAWRAFDGEGNYDYTDCEETANQWRAGLGLKYAHWLEPLYLSAALAPAAVVIPDKLTNAIAMALTAFDIDGDRGTSKLAAKQLRDGVDEFARLNRRAIPVELIEASRRAADILGSQGFAAWDQLAAELRALLGKEGDA